MNWLKYFITFIVCISDFMVLTAIATIIFGMSHSIDSIIFFLILFIGISNVWKQTGGLSHWKKETSQQFYKNWDLICDKKSMEKYRE